MAPPRNLVNLEAVHKAFGERPLLADVSTGVAAGQRVGVVGGNGAGKSTLLAVLAGDEPVDAGRATVASGTRIGVLRQRLESDPEATARRSSTARSVRCRAASGGESTWPGSSSTTSTSSCSTSRPTTSN